MSSISPAVAASIAFPIGCYYLVRPLSSRTARFIISTFGSAAITYWNCRSIPSGSFSGMMRCAFLWMSSIRLVDLMTRPDEERKNLTLLQYAGKFAYFALPISPNPNPRPMKQMLQFQAYHLALALSKVASAHFLRSWLLRCVLLAGGGQVIRQHYLLTVQFTAILTVITFLSTAMNDLQIVFVSAITGDAYRVLEFSRWPILARSFREFWGVRYNRLVSALLKDSVFRPLKELGLSNTLAALATFGVSAALHTHVAHVCLREGELSSFLFFTIHGLLCALETHLGRAITNSPLWGVFTQATFWLTSPLYMGLFVYALPAWLLNNPPELPAPFEIPVPAGMYCPKP